MKEVVVGLDAGSHTIRFIVGQFQEEQELPSVIGVGTAPSEGIRKGVIVDLEDAVASIAQALEKAERMTGVPIERAYTAINGSHITSENSKGVIAVSRADGEIGEDDIMRVIEAAQAVTMPSNFEALHVIPRTFTVDNQEGVKDPIGMSGIRLEAEVHIVEGSSSHVKNLTKAVYRTGVDVEDLVLAPLAASDAVLTKRQKELGVVVIDIGEGTTGVVVFEEGSIVHSNVLPIGAGHVTNDIALDLRTSMEVAERIKLKYGHAQPKEVPSSEKINLIDFDDEAEGEIDVRHLARVIEARVEEIFNLVDKELRGIDRSGKLPAGAVIVGGGAKLSGVVEVAKQELKLPAQIGMPHELPISVDTVDDPSFATAIGLLLWGSHEQDHGGKRLSFGSMPSVNDTVDKMKKWFKQLLP